LVELVGSPPISFKSFAAFCVVLELRLLRSTSITRLHRYYEPLRHPTRPGQSLAGVRLAVTRRHRWGFLCCVGLLSQTCRRHYPGGPVGIVALQSPTAAAFPV